MAGDGCHSSWPASPHRVTVHGHGSTLCSNNVLREEQQNTIHMREREREIMLDGQHHTTQMIRFDQT